MIKVCLIGLGKTGKEIAKMIFEQNNMRIVSAMCSPGSLKKHMDLGRVIGIQDIGIKIEGTNRLEEIILKYRPDVVVDFSKPEATLKNADIVSRMGANLVIGTTGFSVMELKRIENSGTIPRIIPKKRIIIVARTFCRKIDQTSGHPKCARPGAILSKRFCNHVTNSRLASGFIMTNKAPKTKPTKATHSSLRSHG